LTNLKTPHKFSGQLVRPLNFDVSSLSTAICPVRVLLGKQEEVNTLLPDSVKQERGSVVHDFLAEGDTSSLSMIERRQLIDEIISRRNYPDQNPNSVMVGKLFENFFSLSDWNRRVSWIPKINTNKFKDRKQHGPSSRKKKPRNYDDVPVEDQLPTPGPEAWVASRKLKLKGQIDRVDAASDGSWRLSEYKTHNVLTADGQLRESTRAQLLIYALIVRQLRPNDSIELVAYGRESKTVSFTFDSCAEIEAQEVYKRKIALFPEKPTLCVQEDAKPGSDCPSCPSRPCCPAYHDWAQQRWADDKRAKECPLDTWGVVTEVRSEGGYPNGLVYLEDAIGREVLLKFLHPKVVKDTLTRGMKIWCYELKKGASSNCHPQTFFHHRPDPNKAYLSAVGSRIYYSV